MKFLKFERIPYGLLRMREHSDLEMEIIGQFLETDSYSLSEYYLKWLSTDSTVTGGNLTYLVKGENSVSITNNLTDDTVTLTKDQFTQILTQWALVYKPAPKELLIKKINDQFIFEPTYD